MNYSISKTYVLKWQLSTSPNYKFTQDGRCINTLTGREIKRILVGRSIGFCVPKFKSLNTIRNNLEKIPNLELPF